MLSTFDYFKPKNISEAVQYLARKEDTYVLAGGTDLMILLRRNIIDAKHILDIKSIPETKVFQYEEGKGMTIGASVVVNCLLDSDIVKQKYPALYDGCATLASFQLRNRATLVGNLCNASPGADLPPALLVYNTTVHIAGPEGTREVKLTDFFTGVKRTVLKKGEIVVSVHIPDPGTGDRSVYLKQSRLKGHDLATVGVACRRSGDGKVAIAIAAVAPTPLRLYALEDTIHQRGLSEETIDRAAEEIKAHIHPISDVRSSAEYRLHIASVLLKRGLLHLLKKEG